jgi:23S rRNA (pseudouridine1915-N3)-methyltransferase
VRITIVAIGRLKADAERVLVDRYAERIGATRSTALGPVREIELPESRAASAPERKQDEASRLLKQSAGAGAEATVVLDERGKPLTSAAFAAWIGARRDAGCRNLAFLIGGPDGHGEASLSAATLKLSLGPMTLPHGLARAVLVEQIYRASTILAGHPYHRE